MSCCSVKRTDTASSEVGDIMDKEDYSGMVKVPSGTYKVGSNLDIGYEDDFEGPEIEVTTSGFYMDITVVTNAQFKEFVEATGYITEAELLGTSFVFHLLLDNEAIGYHVDNLRWWVDVEGANWKHPFGDKRSYKDIMNHPVVHVTHKDALNYCAWAGKRLPSEVEWEIAARGGKEGLIYSWGNELYDVTHRCNIWQGSFPIENTAEDGYIGTAPADVFYQNDYGLKQMLGNVWELCSNKARIPLPEVKTETLQEQIELLQSETFIDYAAKGGSFLCHHSYCNRYRLAARNGIDRLSASSNVGFRCVKDLD